MKEVKQKYLMHLPDVPRWVETRDLLFFEGSLVFENASNDGFIVWSMEDDFGSVVGNPDPDTLNRAAREVSELLAFPDNIAQVSDLLGNFDAASDHFHFFVGTARLCRLPVPKRRTCR